MKKSIFIFIILIILLSIPIVNAEWWNANWEFRKGIYIEEKNGLKQENFIYFNNIDFKETVNCSKEIRIIDDNGQELPSYILKEDNYSCILFYLYDIVPFSKKTFHVYYGNPDADIPSYRKIKLQPEIEYNLKNPTKIENLYTAEVLLNEEKYMDVITLLENNSLDSDLYSYGASKYYNILGYAYHGEFFKRGLESNIQNEYEQALFFNENQYLIYNSNVNLLKSINLSKCNLPCVDSEMHGSLWLSSLKPLSTNYAILENYEQSLNALNKMDEILSFYSVNSTFRIETEEGNNQLFNLIFKIVEVEFEGDIDPLDFSEPEIKPNIILNSNDHRNYTYFDELHIQFYNQKGLQNNTIKKYEDTFIFNEKLLLEKNNVFIFPFDYYTSEIFNIYPSKIISDSMEISIKDENTNFIGMAYFQNDNIVLKIFRKTGYILSTILYFMLFLIALINANRLIVGLDQSSFQPKIISQSFSFWFNVISLIAFITNSFKLYANFINIIIFVVLIITLIRFCIKYRQIYSSTL